MSETTELVVLNNTTALANAPSGSLFNNTGSKLFSLDPATLNIVQPNSTYEGGIKGNLIISDTGDQFTEMTVALLAEPTERRAYYVGEAGELNRTPENLHCFSNDLVRPDDKAKFPQAHTCASCPRQDWGPFRAKRDKGITTTKADIPPCDSYYTVTLIDTIYQMPLRMFIRSTQKTPFENGMKVFGRKMAMLAATTKTVPNWYDITFKLKTKLVESGKFKYYTLALSDFKATTDEERENFGILFQQYEAGIKAKQQKYLEQSAQAEAQTKVDNANIDIDKAVIDGEYVTTETAAIDDEIPF